VKQHWALKRVRPLKPATLQNQAMARTHALVLLVVLAQLLLACSVLGGGNADPYPAPDDGSDLPVVGPTLACSQECADRGQCGMSADRGRVVLLSADQPAVSPVDFELAVADGAGVSVLETRPVDVEESATGQRFPINFYRVLVQDRGVEGWVPAWCILNP